MKDKGKGNDKADQASTSAAPPYKKPYLTRKRGGHAAIQGHDRPTYPQQSGGFCGGRHQHETPAQQERRRGMPTPALQGELH